MEDGRAPDLTATTEIDASPDAYQLPYTRAHDNARERVRYEPTPYTRTRAERDALRTWHTPEAWHVTGTSPSR
jgi:hypothetical protein